MKRTCLILRLILLSMCINPIIFIIGLVYELFNNVKATSVIKLYIFLFIIFLLYASNIWICILRKKEIAKYFIFINIPLIILSSLYLIFCFYSGAVFELRWDEIFGYLTMLIPFVSYAYILILFKIEEKIETEILESEEMRKKLNNENYLSNF